MRNGTTNEKPSKIPKTGSFNQHPKTRKESFPTRGTRGKKHGIFQASRNAENLRVSFSCVPWTPPICQAAPDSRIDQNPPPPSLRVCPPLKPVRCTSKFSFRCFTCKYQSTMVCHGFKVVRKGFRSSTVSHVL